MRTLVASLLTALALTAGVAGCSGDDTSSPAPKATTTDAAATGATGSGVTEPADGAGGHGPGKYGSSMDPEVVGVKDIAKLGPGPAAGQQWKIWTGINVCGRFVDLAPTSAQPSKGMSVSPAGQLTVAQAAGDPTGHDVTVADFLALYGITASTGTLTFPAGIAPSTLRLPNGSVELSGATMKTGDKCPETPGEVQVWYYTPQAVATGRPIRVVVTDPDKVPIVADGSAIVVAFSPDSSLPTLPPAALVG